MKVKTVVMNHSDKSQADKIGTLAATIYDCTLQQWDEAIQAFDLEAARLGKFCPYDVLFFSKGEFHTYMKDLTLKA